MTQLAQVVFLSQQWAEAYLPRTDEAIISITDRGKPEADLDIGWIEQLRISFDDVDPIEYPAEPEESLIEMQTHQARLIAEFVVRVAENVNTIVVHCKYGQSRSAAVAKAIAEHCALQFPQDYEYANNYVYNLVLAALKKVQEPSDP